MIRVSHPTGELYFKVDSYPGKEWKDAKQSLEDQLVSILAFLELSGQYWPKLHAEQKKAEEARAEKERIAQALKRRKDEEYESFKTLLGKSKRWGKAVVLRTYIDETESRAAQENKLDTAMVEWLAGARKKADWYDPFTETYDELMDDVVRL